MKRALIVDVQHTEASSFPREDRNYYLKKWLGSGAPVHIALTPYQRSFWNGLGDDIVGLASREGSGILLEGLLHVCLRKNHIVRDPHHENICTSFFQSNASYQEQLDRINLGVEFLKKSLGISPVGFVPPQHLWNKDTLKAVRDSGMRYVFSNAMFSEIYPYQREGVIVVPSGSVKHGRVENPVVHVYYDWIERRENLMKEIESDVVPLSEIPIGAEGLKHLANEQFLRLVKQVRDGKRLVKWLTSKKARQERDAETIREERLAKYHIHVGNLAGFYEKSRAD